MSRMMLVAAALLLAAGVAHAQGTDAPGTDARPARGPQQSSVPDAAPPATTGQITASGDQGGKVGQMNQAEKDKVGQGGK